MTGPYQAYPFLQIDLCWNIFALKLAIWLVGYITGLEIFNVSYKAVTLGNKVSYKQYMTTKFPSQFTEKFICYFSLEKKKKFKCTNYNFCCINNT